MQPILTNLQFKGAESDLELRQILALQKDNYRDYVSAEEAQEQGFVSIEHDLALLKAMNEDYPHVIAQDGSELVGYALVMLQKFGDAIPVLFPMFERINNLTLNGVSLRQYRYFIMGQICIAKAHRSRGIFAQLYQNLAQQMKGDFNLIVTEVASRNKRSLRAHEKVGFQILKTYTAEEEWNIIALEL